MLPRTRLEGGCTFIPYVRIGIVSTQNWLGLKHMTLLLLWYGGGPALGCTWGAAAWRTSTT